MTTPVPPPPPVSGPAGELPPMTSAEWSAMAPPTPTDYLFKDGALSPDGKEIVNESLLDNTDRGVLRQLGFDIEFLAEPEPAPPVVTPEPREEPIRPEGVYPPEHEEIAAQYYPTGPQIDAAGPRPVTEGETGQFPHDRGRLFIDRTNAHVDIPEEDKAAIYRYGIPTYQGTKRGGIFGSQEEADWQAPKNPDDNLSRFERMVRKAGAMGYVFAEDFSSTNLEQSRNNKKAMDLLNEMQGTGPDDQIRKLFARRNPDTGQWLDIYTGKEVVEADVRDARSLWMKTPAEMQAAIWYEITKVKSEGEFNMVLDRAFELCNEAAGSSRSNLVRTFTREPVAFSEESIYGIWKGLGFMHKANHLTFKHINFGVNKDPNSPNYGQFDWSGFNAVEFITELSTKFKSYEMSGFSAIDAANISFMTEEALNISLEYRDRPASPEFKKAQYILSRIAAITNELRAGTPNVGVDPTDDDLRGLAAQSARTIQQTQAQGLQAAAQGARQADMYRKESVKWDPKQNRYVYVGAYMDPRTGGAAAVAGQWKKTAAFVDIASDIFPNIKYQDDEFSTARHLQENKGGAHGRSANTRGSVIIGIDSVEGESGDSRGTDSSRTKFKAEDARRKARRKGARPKGRR